MFICLWRYVYVCIYVYSIFVMFMFTKKIWASDKLSHLDVPLRVPRVFFPLDFSKLKISKNMRLCQRKKSQSSPPLFFINSVPSKSWKKFTTKSCDRRFFIRNSCCWTIMAGRERLAGTCVVRRTLEAEGWLPSKEGSNRSANVVGPFSPR